MGIEELMENQALISEEQVFEAIKKGHTDGAVAMLRYIAQEKLWVGMVVNFLFWFNEGSYWFPPENVPDEGWFCRERDVMCYFHIPKELTLEYRRETIEFVTQRALHVSLKVTGEGAIETYYRDERVNDQICGLLVNIQLSICFQDPCECGPASRKVCDIIEEVQRYHRSEESDSDYELDD